MLVAYFDESGTAAGQELTLVGGALARNFDWYHLERPWRDLIQSFGVEWYHAVDCENGDTPFDGMSRGIRDAITNGLSLELSKMTCQGFGSAVWRADFESAPDDIRERCNNDPFFLCLELCLQQISDWSVNLADSEPVCVVFSRQQQYEARVRAIYQAYANERQWGRGLGALVTDANPKLLIPLQAADLYSYELFRYALGHHRNSSIPQRTAWKYLNGGKFAMSYMVHDAASLKRVSEDRRRRKSANA